MLKIMDTRLMGVFRLSFIILLILLMACSRTPENMVYIPAGEFIIGASEDIEEDPFYKYGFNKPFYADATPAHKVFVDSYYIDIYEVSNEQYEDFIQATGHRTPGTWKNQTYASDRGRHPVTGVNWYDALEYCKWMGKRLPTEAEWEKAARGEDERMYSWGNDFSYEKANVSTSPLVPGGTKEVDSYGEHKSPYGIYNMVGNVWEWTADWYDPYPNTQYEFPSFKERPKVTRGNSFSPVAHLTGEEYKSVVAIFSRVTYRQNTPHNLAFLNDVGFRCAK